MGWDKLQHCLVNQPFKKIKPSVSVSSDIILNNRQSVGKLPSAVAALV